MPEIKLTIDHEAGLHARPASLFVQTAKQFTSEMIVMHGEKKANAKSILNVLTLGANQGALITISAEGDDAQAALAAFKRWIESNFEAAS